MFQAKLMVWLTIIVFVIFGALFVVSPSVMFERVTDTEITSTSGKIDISAMYGGLSIAIGVILAKLVLTHDTLRTAVLAASWIAGLMALTRGLAIAVVHNPNETMWLYFSTELFFTMWGLFILRKLRSRRFYFK
ncbi:DUF4345 family protein [Vibrio methylphosphonaticus]|uniref:DUF4345 family protein n=1 Tax=Vibrio methylphosphonaticus TaxID=2946866 RepID=UPI002029FA9D|nr:DUF4345 family protein [Vibrio methylphosphonaticus]MCL9774128.1 DUF4345 domain-containing protein [Vibrio methylphosphonaticus]